MPELAPRQLILTLYGLYARAEHDWLSVGSVVKLLGDLGVDSAGVRSSVSRLKRRGVLESMRQDGAAGYALSARTVEVLREGDERIFGRRRAAPDDPLVLVLFSVPEAERDKRHQLRATLSRMGFGTAAPGVWVAPGHLHDEAARTLDRLGLQPYVDLFCAHYSAFGGLRERIGKWWDLPAIDAECAGFVERYRDLRPGTAPLDAFRTYVPLLTEWRRLPYLDPGLPLELLPEPWHAAEAADLFARLDAVLREPARQHAHATLHP
ncbi:PaaX family transcriptional regulator [Pseudonocardia lacus]|uniref:PaaX family transcriptional regulator n=1 Tax=Pseudonocardia lacus TaxID=2835865 RepID=UPI001BDDC22C|nr:PaaX family transcriptional regulator C-terminal domain-containing protein [Pseudonocardia lacus]